MSIRWRLLTLTLQLICLLLITHYLTGAFFSSNLWFAAGLLSITINPQLWEPYYPKPADVIGNGIAFLFIFASTSPSITRPAWVFGSMAVSIAITLSLIAIFFGKSQGQINRLARAARIVSQVTSAKLIYSYVFILSAVEWRRSLDGQFWSLLGGWAFVLFLGAINWQAVWVASKGASSICRIEGNLGPAILFISGLKLPPIGTRIKLVARDSAADGVVINRIRRAEDDWAHVHIIGSCRLG